MKGPIALCMEYSLVQQGGTEVLVRALAEDLGQSLDVVLVTNDTPESLAASGLKARLLRHIRWNPADQTWARSRRLAAELQALGVQLATSISAAPSPGRTAGRAHAPSITSGAKASVASARCIWCIPRWVATSVTIDRWGQSWLCFPWLGERRATLSYGRRSSSLFRATTWPSCKVAAGRWRRGNG